MLETWLRCVAAPIWEGEPIAKRKTPSQPRHCALSTTPTTGVGKAAAQPGRAAPGPAARAYEPFVGTTGGKTSSVHPAGIRPGS
jgi:hypothetical protein